MRQAHDVDTVRSAEQALMARLPEGALMQRAAAGLAAICAQLLGSVYGSRVVLLVGSGDNGGDALYAGARLASRGARVDALLLGSRTHESGLHAFRLSGGRVSDDVALVDGAELVVDGILGIGGQGGLRAPSDGIAERLSAGSGAVVAVDVPSGVDASTGVVEGVAIRADVTVTFGTWKPGLLIDPGASYAGHAELVDIGLGPYLGEPAVAALQSDDVRALLPAATAESDKYARGVVGVVAGSEAYTGAAVLCTGGALAGGAGMVRYAGPPHPTEIVRNRWPEVVLGEGRCQAWVVGPGLGQEDDARERLEWVLEQDTPVLVDADGLNLIAADRSLLDVRRDRPTLLTPHAGELARLLEVERSDVEARRMEYVRRAADGLGVVVLLKGSTTLVAAPGEPAIRVNATGTFWLATAGSGDVLSGVAGALLAGGLSPLDAGSVGAYLHGLAGRLAADDAPTTAVAVLESVPEALRLVFAG
jgi:ADP-dependent NAD(P)H-hydrate dehydratase / NAD(P)H-hydrate epimerase